MIKGLSHACFVVRDLDKAVGFYTGALGLRVAFDFRNEAGARTGVYLHTGARTFIELFAGKSVPTPGEASYKHVCLEVDDIGASVRAIRAAGVEVSEPKMGSDGSLQAWLKDPDGNAIELHQFLPGSKQTRALDGEC